MKYGAVAAGHTATAKVAMDVLRSGGNATDALIAAYVASFISEPCMGSPGGGAFALIQENGKEPILFDFFCQTPLVKRPVEEYDFRPYTVNFDDDTEVFYFGNGAAATPGAIAGIFAMHRHSGTIPVRTLFDPGIELMKMGVPLSWFQQYDISLLKGIIGHSQIGRKFLLNSKGEAPEIGEIIRLPGLSDFMEVISIEGPREFYEGYYAKMQQSLYDSNGGSLQYRDFVDYKVILRNPISFKVDKSHIYCNPPPALGGIVMKVALERLFDRLDAVEFYSKEYFKSFYNAFISARDCQMDPGKQSDWLFFQQNRKWGSTSHLSIIDAFGNSAALTTTIGEGNGHFDPLSHTHMNNMLGESALLPGGFHSWIPNTRLSSMMNPVLVKGEEGDSLVLGTGGAGRIPYALSCTLWNLLRGGMDLKEAVEAPRVHLDSTSFHIEKQVDVHLLPRMSHEVKYWKKPSLFFGGVHAVRFRPKSGAEGVGDFRREGTFLIE
ncbi:MAG: hypothetical protein EA409_01700 [Saprospirales bacterium]|nr:MAG: hypothetical protein EA409_01700 [Saprospirales bacterium]